FDHFLNARQAVVRTFRSMSSHNSSNTALIAPEFTCSSWTPELNKLKFIVLKSGEESDHISKDQKCSKERRHKS
ncbi:Hypothetical protein FKW44_005649, partial [Caligus rogercresseyi]